MLKNQYVTITYRAIVSSWRVNSEGRAPCTSRNHILNKISFDQLFDTNVFQDSSFDAIFDILDGTIAPAACMRSQIH
jgi:hypothetical protein